MKFRPQMQLRFRDESQYERIKALAVRDELSVNEWILQAVESVAVERGLRLGDRGKPRMTVRRQI